MEAVLMLAGKTDRVDEGVRDRIERAAQALLSKINPASGRVYDLDEIDAERNRRRSATSGSAKKLRRQPR
jgi:hypothetical protein